MHEPSEPPSRPEERAEQTIEDMSKLRPYEKKKNKPPQTERVIPSGEIKIPSEEVDLRDFPGPTLPQNGDQVSAELREALIH